ncbi:MAG: NAD(P)H-dependent oxidoreductase [Bryobacteraceae bacterium]|jgi:multimeric flavodoxin WrbA
MPEKKVVILDGAGSGDSRLSPILDVLSQVLHADGAQVETFPLREMKLAHCLGCFNCWIKTPGICVEADAGREIAKAIVRSDVTVLFTPVTFGGYSPELKKMVDRLVQLASPFFEMDHGEVHHPPRYAHRPRLVMVGVQRHSNPDEAHIFKILAGRNAINFHPPSYAAEVVLSDDAAGTLRARFEALLSRSDALPFGDAAASLMPAPVIPGPAVEPAGARRALLIVGSPKTNEPSTSGALGGYLLDRLKERGWETTSLTLRASLNRPEGESELLSSVERAGLILLVFPLYVDALPYLVTKALAVIAARGQAGREPSAQRLVVIVNSGFPETHQNSVALAICREFAAQSGFMWAGGLAVGGGGMIGGQPLTGPKRSGPPVQHVIAALEMTAAAVAESLPVPAAAASMIVKNRIPFALFRWLYVWMGGKSFEKLAAKNGIGKDQLLARPYAA